MKHMTIAFLRRYWSLYWPLALITILVGVLAMGNLGDRHFWGDETNQLFLSESITRHGLPIADNEVRQLNTLFEIYNPPTNETSTIALHTIRYSVNVFGYELYNAHPWLVSYIAAIPIALFGSYNEFLIRLPFVILGLLALPIIFCLALRMSKKRRIAYIATLLLGFSIVYLLAVRNTLYYSIVLFAVPATIWCYLRIMDQNKHYKDKHAWWQFVLAGAMIFHSQWLIFVSVMLGIVLHAVLFYKIRVVIKQLLGPLGVMFCLTFPWFVITDQFAKSTVLSTPLQYVTLLAIGIYHVLVWFVPLVLLVFVPSILVTRRRKTWHFSKEYILLVIIIIISLLFTSLNYLGGTPIRYFYGILPLAMILNAVVIDKIWSWKKEIGIIVLALMLFSNVVQILPLLPLKSVMHQIAGTQNVMGTDTQAQFDFVVQSLKPRLLLGEYVYEITHSMTSSTRAILDEMHKATSATGSQEGSFFVDPNVADGNALSYYTRLRPSSYSYKFGTYDYDWIALPKNDDRNQKIDSAKYTQKYIPLATEKWGDTADPVHHLFRTTTGEGFYLYRLKNNS